VMMVMATGLGSLAIPGQTICLRLSVNQAQASRALTTSP
jgi:hypothetical protein